MRIEIDLSEQHEKQLAMLAARENKSPERFAADIVAEAIAQAHYLEQRGLRGNLTKFRSALESVPDHPVVPPDSPVN